MQSATSDKTFHLKWNNHLQNLSQLFTTIYSSSALADVTLSCRDGSIRAHKLVLSACSPYFEQIFKENPCKHPVIILKGIPYAEINLLVEFMYKGSVDVQELDLQSLMHTASELEIRGLAYEVRKDASSLLNVNLNEYPSFPATPNVGQDNSFTPNFEAANPTCSSPYDSTPRTVNPYQTNLERLRQIHMYQQAMCRNTQYSNAQGQTADGSAIKRKRKNDEPMPATTTTAVKNILAAAAKELAEKKNPKISTCIQTEDDMEVVTMKIEQEEEEEEDEAPLHGRDTRFKGKKRVSVGMQNDYTPMIPKTKPGKPQTRVSTATTASLTDSADVMPAPEVSTFGSGILKCVDLENLRESHDDATTVLEDNDDSSGLDTSDDNNLLVETAYENAAPEDEYDSSDSKPDPNAKSEKIFKCDLCDLSYSRNDHMVRHRRTHSGDRPYKCNTCPYSFNRSSHLARHRRTHTGERPYRCEACGRCFARGDKLKLHMRICEKDEYVLPGNASSTVDDSANKKEMLQQTMVPGMVSIGHSERHHLMFTPSGEVMLAPRTQTEGSKEINSSLASKQEASQSMLETPGLPHSSSDRLNYSDGGYPMKRGRGRPRKKPLPPIELPIVKKRRGRPPKVIKMDPLDHSRPIENYTSSNLPYGDFSYLTDIISTHFNQSTQQAYQNMMQINPMLAANALSNALSSQGIPLIQSLENIKNQPPLQEKINPTPLHNVPMQKMPQSTFTAESSIEKNPANSTDVTKLNRDTNVSQITLPEGITKIQERNESIKVINLESLSKNDNVANVNSCEENKQVISGRDQATNDEDKPKQKVVMVGDCQIVKINDALEGSSNAVTTIGECTIQPVSQNK